MNKLNPAVDLYFLDGCGRCSLYATPQCRVHLWDNELAQLRMIALESGLTEELKWKHPCYTIDGKNVLLLGAFKDNCVMSFFKGALLKDEHGILEKPGADSHSDKVLRINSLEKIEILEPIIRAYILEAIAIHRAGLKIESKAVSDYDFPEELLAKFEALPTFKTAFEALTPGRQKGYLLHFSQAKQSKTRMDRIEKYIDKIFAGKGWQE
jgi:uncharacterized protein YdeI (YjbR/CyaY-like superfamily)